MHNNRMFPRRLWCLVLVALLIGSFGLHAFASDVVYGAEDPAAAPGIEVLAPYEEDRWDGASVSAVQLDASGSQTPTISCASAVVVDMDNGDVVYDYNGGKSSFPASTTKIMTAYLCLKYGDLNAYVTVKPGILSDVISGATTLGLVTGERIQVRALLQSMLLISSCDSANVIAQHVRGSIADFAALMNQEAKALGCTGTHFTCAHGLPDSSHYTTARDMTLIARAAMAYPEFRQIVGSHYIDIPATNIHGARRLENINEFMPFSGSQFAYPYATGIKTGTTTAAGYCLVSSAEKDGVRLLAVVFGSSSRAARYNSSRNLYQWAFENYHPDEDKFPFLDVPKGAWYYDTVKAAYEAGIVNGMSATTFGPQQNVTRAQLVTLLYRMVGSPSVHGTTPFQDLTQSWYQDAVTWAWENNVVYGISATAFSPSTAITRQDLTTILYRYAGSPKVTGNELAGFSDAQTISNYARDAVEWAVENGIMNGSNQQIKPRDTATRAEACALLMRFRDYLGKN